MAINERYQIDVILKGQNQLSPTADKVTGDLQKLDNTVSQNNRQWDTFKSAATTAIGAVGLALGAAGIAAEINAIGRAAISAEITFNQVSGGADNAADSLARMRQMTGGVIDDMNLMRGANSLLVTGVAQTNEQAEELVNLGARLGAVMGVDATESIQNLNSALLNNSFLRLDTLGISAARVRERVNELKEAGLDMSAAFAQSVVEIGGQTLEDLGSAADVANTAIARLSTRAVNFGQNAAEVMATGLEQAAVSFEQLIALADIALGGTGGVQVLEEQAAAAEAAQAEFQALVDLATRYYGLEESANFRATGSQMMNILPVEMAIAFRESDREIFEQISSGSWVQEQLAAGNGAAVQEALFPLFGNMSIETFEQYAVAIDASLGAVAQAQTHLTYEATETANAIEAQTRAMIAQNTVMGASRVVFQNVSSEIHELTAMSNDLSDSFASGVFSTSGGAVFFDPAQLANVQTQSEAIVDEYERLKELGESSEFTLVSEDEVERARQIAEQAENSADEAERFARAFETATLAQLAGATGGGRENEFYQGVLAQIEDPEIRAQVEQQFNLQSGVETANTQVVEYAQALNAAIIEEFGSGRGAQAGAEIALALEQGMMAGLQGIELQRFVEEQVGFALGTSQGGTSVGGEQIQVQAGEGYIALAQRTGYSREELEAATGGARMLMAGEVITIDNNQLIALDEGTAVQDIASAAASLLGGFRGAMGGAQGGAESFAPQADYTYYDPATGTLSYSNDPEQQFSGDKSAENVASMAENILIVEESMLSISELDAGMIFDPMTEDVIAVNSEISSLEQELQRLAATEFRLELPLDFVLDMQTAEMLARNSSVLEVFRLVLPRFGVQNG